jgi:ribosome-binding factor A
MAGTLSEALDASVTVLGVEIGGDLRNATVSVSVMGSEADQERAMKGQRNFKATMLVAVLRTA